MENLNSRESRVYTALLTMVSHNPSQVLVTSYKQVSEATSAGITTVKEAIKSMRERGIVEILPKAFGGGLRIRVMPISRTIDNNGHPISRPIEPISRPIDALNSNTNSEEEEARVKKFFVSVLKEFGMREPFLSHLVDQFLLPGYAAKRVSVDDVRAECVRTQQEAKAWRSPERILFARLKRRANGEQNPLPLVFDVEKEAPRQRHVSNPRRGSGQRDQVAYTEESRTAIASRAEAELAELEARRARRAARIAKEAA